MTDHKVNIFSQVPTVSIDRNEFERNHQWKGTLDSGVLVPVFFDEVLPGDTKKLNTTFFGRMTTPIVPIMDNIYLDYHLFFVPRRLVWDNWPKFMGERKNPGDSIDYLVPQIENAPDGGFGYETYFDYLSMPPNISNITTDACYYRAINLIWNEWYRDENLQDSLEVPTDDGPDDYALYNKLLRRGKRMDYFTSALPSPQKGPGVDLPISGSAPVWGDGNYLRLTSGNQTSLGSYDAFTPRYFENEVGNFTGLNLAASGGNYSLPQVKYAISATSQQSIDGMVLGVIPKGYGSTSGLYADLSSTMLVTINSLRQAFALQQFLELDARGGTRYVELIMAHFGVRSPDYRLQRPEYLGGGSTRININPVAQTSSTDATTPQGNLGAYATVASTGNGFVQSFTEHGIILGFVSIRADLNYQQGIDRHFSRRTRYDFYFPTLAHLGEQGILNKEIYAQGTNVDNDIFGYQERYAEYRYKPNYVTGKLRSSHPQSLDIWHLAQNFTALPTLNAEFIEERPPIKRALAVQDEPEFLLDAYHEFDDIRPVALYGTPGLMRM